MTDSMRLSFFKNRREVLDWIYSIGWSIRHGFDDSWRHWLLLVNDRGRILSQARDNEDSLDSLDCLIVYADTYAYGCVDEYNHPEHNHSRRVTKLAKAALSIRSKKGE